MISAASNHLSGPPSEPLGPPIPDGAPSPLGFEAMLDELSAQAGFMGREMRDAAGDLRNEGTADVFNEHGLFGEPGFADVPPAFVAEPGQAAPAVVPMMPAQDAQLPTVAQTVGAEPSIDASSIAAEAGGPTMIGIAPTHLPGTHIAASGQALHGQSGPSVTERAQSQPVIADARQAGSKAPSERTTGPEPRLRTPKMPAVPTPASLQDALSPVAVALSGGSARVNVGARTSALSAHDREQLEQRIAGELARHGLAIGRITLSTPSVAPAQE